MSLALRHFLFGRGARIDPAISAVVADPVHRSVVDNRGVVNVVNVGDIYVVDGAIIEKMSALPTSAFISIAEVAESVIDPTVESDMRSPKA